MAETPKKINVGLNLLRIVLTFGFVLDHFWIRDSPGILTGIERAVWHMRTLAVPAFMTMTFFFTADHFRAGDASWLKKRFVRLYEPFIFWALAYWVLRMGVSVFNPEYATSFHDLAWQLVLGSSRTLTMQFWFHADLIILTAAFFLAFRVVRIAKANLYLALGAIAVGFTVQYTPLNAMMFSGMGFETKYPLGRVFAMLPYAGAGFLMAAAKRRIDALSAGEKVVSALFGLWLAWFVIYWNVCPNPHEVVGYEGLGMNLIAWGVMAAFYHIPFHRLPAAFEKAVLAVSRYAMGVYCVHLALGWLFYDYVLRLPKIETSYGEMRAFSFAACLAVWALSYAFCALFARIPLGICRRVVE